MPITRIGLFQSDTPFDRKQLAVMHALEAYYTEHVLRTMLVPIISSGGDSNRLSLRALDWLVTNYAKKMPIIYKVKPDGMPERLVNIYTEYKTLLWKYRRANFDPFRRRHRITFQLDGTEYNTTVGQLNFMYWASRYGIIEYAHRNIDAIENDHASSVKSGPAPDPFGSEKRKRRQLSQVNARKVFVFGQPVKVCFTPGVEPPEALTK
jgi:hypothetical protein